MPASKFINRNLFSNHYLENLIKSNPEWEQGEHEDAFKKIKVICDEGKDKFGSLNEVQLGVEKK